MVERQTKELAKEFGFGCERQKPRVNATFLGREVHLQLEHFNVNQPFVAQMALPVCLHSGLEKVWRDLLSLMHPAGKLGHAHRW